MGTVWGGQATICRICRTRVTRLPAQGQRQQDEVKTVHYRRTRPQGARHRARWLEQRRRGAMVRAAATWRCPTARPRHTARPPKSSALAAARAAGVPHPAPCLHDRRKAVCSFMGGATGGGFGRSRAAYLGHVRHILAPRATLPLHRAAEQQLFLDLCVALDPQTIASEAVSSRIPRQVQSPRVFIPYL